MVALQFREYGAQFGEPLRQNREGPLVLAGVMPAQCRAERQTVRPQLPWPLAAAVEVGIDVLTESVQLVAEPDVDFDQLVAETP